MSFRCIVIMFGLSFMACKSVSRKVSEPLTAEPVAAEPVSETIEPVPPSADLQNTPHLVTPGPDEALILRGPGARCPNRQELDEVTRAVQSMDQETISLVEEDLNNIQRVSTRTDLDGIGSCCNQMEQLVQDVEIMNEDKDRAMPYIEKIRQITIRICPPPASSRIGPAL